MGGITSMEKMGLAVRGPDMLGNPGHVSDDTGLNRPPKSMRKHGQPQVNSPGLPITPRLHIQPATESCFVFHFVQFRNAPTHQRAERSSCQQIRRVMLPGFVAQHRGGGSRPSVPIQTKGFSFDCGK